MPQSKEVHKEYMRQKRKVHTKGSQNQEVHTDGSQGITVDKDQAIKLLHICDSLDKSINGLYGRVNMLDIVRRGSLTMREVRSAIHAHIT